MANKGQGAGYRLPAIDINTASHTDFVERAGFDDELARRIIAGRPYAVPEDLLRRSDLYRPSWAPHIVKLLLDGRTPGADTPLYVSRRATRHTHRSGVVFGIDRSDPPRAFITHPLGQEIASAALNENGRLDLPTFRLFGWPPGALAYLPLDAREQARQFLRGSGGLWAGSLFADEAPLGLPESEEAAIRELSSHIRALQVFGRRALFDESVGLGAHGDPPYNYLTNGCTGVPDFDYKKCCDEHDLCYSRTPLGFRWGCDLEIARCIAAKGGPEHWILGVLYGLGVLVLGGPLALPWAGIITGGDPPAHVGVPQAVTPCSGHGKCRYRFHLLGVHNAGPDPLSSDSKYRFGFSKGPSDPKPYTTGRLYLPVGHGTGAPAGDIVSDFLEAGSCGDRVGPLQLYVEEPDLGFGKLFTIGQFHCCDNPAPDDIELEFAIMSGMLIKDRTIFRLKLKIETECR